MKLKYFIIRRILAGFVVVIGTSFLVFALASLIPSNPVYLWAGMGSPGRSLSPVEIERIVKMYHLDEPWYIQYYYYLGRLLRGDLGYSPIRDRPVMVDLATYLPNTIELGVFGLALAVMIGVPLGVLSATKRGLLDHLSRLSALLGISLPLFWIGLIFQIVFYYRLRWIPDPGGRVTEAILFSYPLRQITSLPMLDSLLTGNWPVFLSLLQHIFLPGLCIALYPLAVITRMTRSSMMEVLSQDYVRTARAYGLSERMVIYKLALKNALIPTTTVIGLSVGWLLTGSVVVETIFYWPGIGRYAVDSIYRYDFPALIGFIVFAAMIKVAGNLAADILYGVFDPRIRRD